MKREQHINLKPDKKRFGDGTPHQDDQRKMPLLAVILIVLIIVCMAVLLLSVLSAYW
jgi:hypothetical protein